MTQANIIPTTIRPISATPANPLDLVVQNCGRKLMGLQMTRLVGEADKSDAQALTRDLLDVSRIIDEALLAIGREAKAHFGSHVDLALYADRLRDSLEQDTLFNLSEAIEIREEEIAEEMGEDGDTRYKLARDYAA